MPVFMGIANAGATARNPVCAVYGTTRRHFARAEAILTEWKKTDAMRRREVVPFPNLHSSQTSLHLILAFYAISLCISYLLCQENVGKEEHRGIFIVGKYIITLHGKIGCIKHLYFQHAT